MKAGQDDLQMEAAMIDLMEFSTAPDGGVETLGRCQVWQMSQEAFLQCVAVGACGWVG